MSIEPVPNLRAAAALSQEQVAVLREAGLRSLPAAHELRTLACWSRRAWRPAVRVHALRALVRSPAALGSLSARAQDMLFAVFRTINAANREVAAQIFGVLLLSEDPWLIDVGGDGANGDAQRAIDAFLRLYDARHQFLGDANASAGGFVNPDLLHRESDALRRHLHQIAPRTPESASKSRRISPDESSVELAGQKSDLGSASAMRGVDLFAASSSDGGDDRTGLEARVVELTREVETMKEQLRDNERRITNLHSTFDFLAKVLLDEFTTSTCVVPQIIGSARPDAESPSGLQTMEVERMEDHPASNEGRGSPQDTETQQSPLNSDPTASKPPAGRLQTDQMLPVPHSPEQEHRVRKPSIPRSGYVVPHPTPTTPAEAAQSAAKAGDSDQRRRLLETFRNFVEATPWASFPGILNPSPMPSESLGGAGTAGADVARGPIKVFRNGRWVERKG